MKNRIINLYIIREITHLFLLGISIFTMILLMGRLIKLTDMVLTRGVPLADVGLMIVYLLPSFLLFTIPMAFLLAVLLAFGRLSADNEITVLKAGGISLIQLLPPVLLCGACAAILGVGASLYGVPKGNAAFKKLSVAVVTRNITATLREKVFWDALPGLILYCEQYDDQSKSLRGVLINDGRDPSRPLTIFAANGRVSGGAAGEPVLLILSQGSIHSASGGNQYRLVNFGEYVMAVANAGSSAGGGLTEIDMGVAELARRSGDVATPLPQRRKLAAELHSRFALPCASLVFAIVAVPLGIQNRRSGKSAGFSISIALLLAYYLLMSFLRTVAEKGALPAAVGMWLPDLLFAAFGGWLLWRASHEKTVDFSAPLAWVRNLWKRS